MAKWLQISCLLSLVQFVKYWLFDGPHLLSPFSLSASHSGEGSSLLVGLPHSEIPLGSFPGTLSFPPANFSFDLQVPGFLLRTSHILAERLWQLDLDSAVNSCSLSSQQFSARDVLGVSQALLCWSVALLPKNPAQSHLLLRQLALLWNSVLFHSCSRLYPAVTHPVTSIQTGTFF